jgi:hypothetical protein
VLAKASEQFERIEGGRLLAGDLMGAPAAVGAGLAGTWDIKPIESDGRVDQIAAKPLDPRGIAGFDTDGVVHGKSRVLPSQNTRGDVFVELAAADEHLQDAAPEQLFSDSGRRALDGSEGSVGINDPRGDEGVDMWLPVAALKLP